MDAKISRAHEHIETLETEMGSWIKDLKHRFHLKTDQQNAWLVYYNEDPHPPIRLSTIIGDCLFNMRSALDSLACGLVRTVDPASLCKSTYFPIYTDSAKWTTEGVKKIKGVPAGAEKIIFDLQPFNDYPLNPKLHPLSVINNLCNVDKHRAVNLTSVYSKNTLIALYPERGGCVHVHLLVPLYGDSPTTIDVQVGPEHIGSNVRIEAKASAVLALKEENPCGDSPVNEILRACLDFLDDRLVPALKPFFV